MNFEYEKCDLCKDKISASVPGWYFTDEGQTTLRECECHIKWRERNSRLAIAKRSDIRVEKFLLPNSNPVASYHGKNSPGTPVKVEYIIKNIQDPKFKRASVFFHGKTGTQKTYMLQWMGYSLTLLGFKVIYAKFQNVMNKFVSKSFDGQSISEAQAYYNKLMNCDFLLLDDFMLPDRSTLFDWQTPHIDMFLRERIETLGKPIYFASYTKPENCTMKVFGESTRALVDRTIRKFNTYLPCQDVYQYIDNLDNLFPTPLEGAPIEEN